MLTIRLKEILAQRGITLTDFAQSAGMSQSNLSNYINGKISPTLETVKKIATFLDIDVVDLFKDEDEVELFARYKGKEYPITKKDFMEFISQNKS